MKKILHTELEESSSFFKKLYSWRSQERYWVPRDRSWYVLYSFFFVLLIGVAAILAQYMLILAIVAFAFLWFIQAMIPPQITEHSITTIGVRTYDRFYKWAEIKYFWFAKKDNMVSLLLEIIEETNPNFTKRVTLLIQGYDEDEIIFDTLIKFIDYGSKDDVSYNPFVHLLHGKYIDVSEYLKELPQPEIEDAPHKRTTHHKTTHKK